MQCIIHDGVDSLRRAIIPLVPISTSAICLHQLQHLKRHSERQRKRDSKRGKINWNRLYSLLESRLFVFYRLYFYLPEVVVVNCPI